MANQRGSYSTLVLVEGNQTAIYDFDREIFVHRNGSEVKTCVSSQEFRKKAEDLRTASDKLYQMALDRNSRSFGYENMHVTSGSDVQKLVWQVGGIL